MSKAGKFIASFVVTFAAAAIGSMATMPNLPTWYDALQKPAFNPPNWVFGPVWTILYILMALALYKVWTTPFRGSKKAAFWAYGVQLALNSLWSLTFFGFHAPTAGVVVIGLMWLAIVMTMQLFWPVSRAATYLLVPYIAWVSFATALNVAVAALN